jgi:predicted flap endonuclease-1-like 5' DNA nuclease
MEHHKVLEIEGIGKHYAKQLKKAGIETAEDLLSLCCTPKGRKETAKKAGLTAKQLLTWADMADLMRVKGLGPQNAELLKKSGVDTVKELKHRRADNLTKKMKEVNESHTHRIQKGIISEKRVRRFINAAKRLKPRMMYH